MFQSKQRKSLNNICQSNNFYSTTQSLFPSKKSSLKPIQLEEMQLTKPDFYKTMANSTSWGGWVRPESKQSFRKLMSRPQTSKGFRKQPGSGIVFSNIENERVPESKIKSVINSKRRSKPTEKQEWNQNDKKWQAKRNKSDQNQNKTYEQFHDIEIVINRRACESIKKAPSVHKNKFETDLDDEFLELFAD